MPFTRITTNFIFENELEIIDGFRKILQETLKIPENDRLIA